ncbi:MAG: hypothetical protein IJK23_03295, partial [Clostridia bacterium]|nr:hypothetical protein [Clostridia bacterium]
MFDKKSRHTMQRILAVLMSIFMLATTWVFSVPTANAAFSVWDGTVGDPGYSQYYNSGDDYYLESARALVHFLNRIANGNTFSGKTIHLLVDVDLNGINMSSAIPYYTTGFEGTFDGQGHTIANFYFTHDNHRVAMFRTAKNATFKNLTFTNVYVDDINDNGKNGFAVLVGYGDGSLTFQNITITGGVVYGWNYVGGLVGEYGADSILTCTDCSNSATIYADRDRAGSLVGHSKGRVYATRCSNTGTIHAGTSDGGGLAGWIEDDESYFVDCSNTGNVDAEACAGGIFGYFGSKSNDNNMTLTNCSNTGNITSSTKAAGGIGGWCETDGAHTITGCVNRGTVYGKQDAGGILGINSGSGTWSNNKNYGSVTANDDNCGGICGELEDDKQTFTDCYNTGAITGNYSTGGIMGWQNTAENNEYTHCFNTGAITSNNGKAGGVTGAGKKQITYTECFNIGEIRGNNDSGGIAGSIEYHVFFYRCFNAGKVTAPSGKSAGGLIGYVSYNGGNNSAQMVVDCFNWGAINAGTAGGLVGWVDGGSAHYHVANSYNTGSITGSTTWQFVGNGGTCDGNCYKIVNTGSGTYKTHDEFVRYDFSISSNFCRNTWGVKIGSSTCYYPILTWYRNMFTFTSVFTDAASGVNQTITKKYGEAFTVPNPTRAGFSSYKWRGDGDPVRVLTKGASVSAGVTANMNFYTVTQSFSEPTEVKNTASYALTWREGASASMYAATWADGGYKNTVDYAIYNLTSGSDVRYDSNSPGGDYSSGSGIYRKSYQRNGTGSATATLEVDRSAMDDISETGIFLEYYPSYITPVGGVRWGVEVFDPSGDPKGELDNTHHTATITGTKGGSYSYSLHFGSPTGALRCAETNSDFTSEPGGTVAAERVHGPYTWYFSGAAPAVGESVTLRILAICCARHNSDNLQMLSEWTDVTITGVCRHTQGFTAQTASDEYKASSATCTAKAKYYYSCPVCGESENDASHTFESGSALGHDMTPAAAVPANCNAEGNSAYWHCSRCEKYFSDANGDTEIAANSWILPTNDDHAYAFDSFVWSEDGTTAKAKYVCTRNGSHVAQYNATMNDDPHDPTCTEAGYTIYTASYDGHTDAKTVAGDPATGHTYAEPSEGDWTWTKTGDTYIATVEVSCVH